MNLPAALELHQQTVARFVYDAQAIDEARWHDPIAAAKWSPAQVVDHVARTYETLLGEARGGSGMKIRTKFVQRQMLRLLLLPAILRGKRPFPEGARSPRELVPAERPAGKAELLSRLSSLAKDFEIEIAKRPAASLTHAYFGKSRAADAVRFVTIHTEHHRKQIA